MSSRLFLIAGLAAALAVPAAAQSFDTSARPAAGTLSPRADRAPEMLDLTIRGATETGRDDCVGYVEPGSPDAVVDWGGGALRITTRSSTDATLAVVDPQGVWHCNDDGEGLAPVVELPDAARGRYVVWVGSFVEGGGGAATLVAGAPSQAAQPDPEATPQERVELTGGFSEQGAVERTVTAGAIDAVVPMNLATGDLFCSGFVDAAHPTARVRYTAGGVGRLTLRATSDGLDPMLLVRTPDGRWLCDDDSGEGVNAALAVEDAATGDYTVWVGSFGSLARTEGGVVRLALGEDEVADPDMDFDMDGMDFQATPYSSGTYRPLDLDARPSVRLDLRTDEAVSADVSFRPDGINPVAGDACRGNIETAATAAVTFSGDGPVGITATGSGDLVLLVQTPAGEWLCSDDADGLNPGIQIDQPEAGTYRVWVGSFGEMGEDEPAMTATLALARGEIVVSGGGGMGGGLGSGEPYGEGTYDGSDLMMGQAMQTLQIQNGSAEARVMAGGPTMNPVAGPTCSGFVSAQPTAAIDLSGAFNIMATTVDTADDLVLLVRTPDGRWFCGDDANGTSDPMIVVDAMEGGTYQIWVGTFSRRDTPVAATLTVGQ